MSRIPRTVPAESPPGRRTRPAWRRLAVLAVAPLLALSTATSAAAQGVWVTVPSMPSPTAQGASAAADCPEGLRGTCVYNISGIAPHPLEAYSPVTNTWATLPSLKTPRNRVAATTAPCPEGVQGDCVYAVGGEGATTLATNEAYSTRTNVWLTLRPMPTARFGAAAATAPCPEELGPRGRCVYVTGGSAAGGTTVEAYNPATNTWATLPPLQTGRVFHASAAAPCPSQLGLQGTCVYAIGGQAAAPLSSVEVYSPLLNAWQYVPDMPTARAFLAAATAPCPEGMSDGCVYAVGGQVTGDVLLNTTEAYSPVTNAWVTLPPMPTPRSSLGAAAAPCPKNTKNDCVYALGGLVQTDGTAASAIAEAFSIERGRRDWTQRPPNTPTPAPVPAPQPELVKPEPAKPTRPESKPAPAKPAQPKPAPAKPAKPAPKPTKPTPKPADEPIVDYPDEAFPPEDSFDPSE